MSELSERQPSERRDLARGERYFQGLLDEESRRVPESLRTTSTVAIHDIEIATERYFDPAFHQLEVEHMWSRTWQMACREEQIADVGDSHRLRRSPTRRSSSCATAPDEIRAFHNSCLHRGTQLRTGSGRRRPGCVARSTGSPGTSTAASARCRARGTSRTSIPATSACPQAQVGTWGGFVFVNLDPDGRAARRVPRRSPVALRRVAARGPLPLRARGTDHAVQLEGGARGVHRGVPHGGGPPAAARAPPATP